MIKNLRVSQRTHFLTFKKRLCEICRKPLLYSHRIIILPT
nr:hypothetical protein [uncultured bacterium]